MCMNSAAMFDTETVSVRPVNCYGPNEHYTPYQRISYQNLFINAIFGKPYTVYKGHKRIIDYVEDTSKYICKYC